MSDSSQSLHEALVFRRPPIWDPATYLLREKLDQSMLQELAIAHLEHEKVLAQAQLNLIEKTQAIYARAAKK
ncbi:MAG: hypothetical protein JO182_07000 [Acidobacteriaceae bacterium]|nr:hypothetical protein [Acidobacteriaceae bacterium]MBV9034226.1 hypothetical protein [Acidobacteriaceae bacterium]MBV9224216.1 hypothetical protein [Acidobacteriaceae bacterium]MBV9307041.1 hypothetical protein [Acidobacteriaceae bacterium]MBV9679410.1 hypothetical protein [Acidobacteriaceae bacterium]